MFEFCNPFTFSLLTACIHTLMVWLENKMYKIEKPKKEYFKSFILVAIVSLIVLFLYDSVNTSVKDLEIYTGAPGF